MTAVTLGGSPLFALSLAPNCPPQLSAPTDCSRGQMYSLAEYQGSFMHEISTKRAFAKPNNGCYHCFTRWELSKLECVSYRRRGYAATQQLEAMAELV